MLKGGSVDKREKAVRPGEGNGGGYQVGRTAGEARGQGLDALDASEHGENERLPHAVPARAAYYSS